MLESFKFENTDRYRAGEHSSLAHRKSGSVTYYAYRVQFLEEELLAEMLQSLIFAFIKETYGAKT